MLRVQALSIKMVNVLFNNNPRVVEVFMDTSKDIFEENVAIWNEKLFANLIKVL